LTAAPFVERAEWRDFLRQGEVDEEAARVRACTRLGRPCGGSGFVEELEKRLGRPLRPRKPGPKGPRRHRHGPSS